MDSNTQSSNDEKNLGLYKAKSRRSGETLVMCVAAERELKRGGSVALIGNDKNYLGMVKRIFKDVIKVSVEFSPIKELRPKNNKKMHYDDWGEPIRVEMLPQKLEIIGWKITLKK